MDTLFHYCSNEAFLSIITSKKIRLSSLSLANDAMEGKIVARVFRSLAEADKLEEASISRVEGYMLKALDDFIEGVGFCLSEDGDLLSQWRGYASDGQGVSIGFTKRYFERLSNRLKEQDKPSFTVRKVEYDPEKQKTLIAKNYAKLKLEVEAGAFKMQGSRSLLDARSEQQIAVDDKAISDAHQRLYIELLGMMLSFHSFKDRAFAEEREWRLLAHNIISDLAKYPDLDLGVNFAAHANKLVPYQTIELVDIQIPPIAEVILRPKNITPEHVFRRALFKNGHRGVLVRGSAASYR